MTNFKITQISNFEFKVERNGKSQIIGGLSTVKAVERLLSTVTNEENFFAKF